MTGEGGTGAGDRRSAAAAAARPAGAAVGEVAPSDRSGPAPAPHITPPDPTASGRRGARACSRAGGVGGARADDAAADAEGELAAHITAVVVAAAPPRDGKEPPDRGEGSAVAGASPGEGAREAVADAAGGRSPSSNT